MRCPDDALLDGWLDRALAEPEREAVGAHLAACASCAARRDARLVEERGWRAALALDAAELAQLARADIAAVWRHAAPPARPARWWPALAVLGLAGAAVAWLVAMPDLEPLVSRANRVGLLGLALAWLLGQAWHLGVAALNALAAPPLINPAVVAAGIAACLWLAVSRPWAPSLTRDPESD